MMRRFLTLLPIIIFACIVGFFVLRLVLIERGDTPDKIPSAFINKEAPKVNLPALLGVRPGFKTDDLKGHVTIINFFASWCVPCRAEHALLTAISGRGATLVGINVRNRPDQARAWLKTMGNPYDAVAADIDGKAAIEFGVYGMPETFLVDKQGVIRFKQAGPLTAEVIHDRLLPLIDELNQ